MNRFIPTHSPTGGDTVTTAFIQAEREEAQRQREILQRDEQTFRAERGRNNSVDRYLDNKFGTVLVRTDFSDDEAWRELVDYVAADRDGLIGADLVAVDNHRYEGWQAGEFLDAYRDAPENIVIAGSNTFSHPERPVVYLRVSPDGPDDTPRGTIRAVAASSVALLQVN